MGKSKTTVAQPEIPEEEMRVLHEELAISRAEVRILEAMQQKHAQREEEAGFVANSRQFMIGYRTALFDLYGELFDRQPVLEDSPVYDSKTLGEEVPF